MAVLEEIDSDAPISVPAAQSSQGASLRQRASAVAPSDAMNESSFDEWSLEDSDSDAVYDEQGSLRADDEPTATELYEDLQEDKLSEKAEHIFDLVLWCIPFGFAFELLNLLAQKQYHQETTWAGEVMTLAQRLPRTYDNVSRPALFLLIWWSTSRYLHTDLHEKRRWLTQAVMFVIGTVTGCYLAYVVNKVSVGSLMLGTVRCGTRSHPRAGHAMDLRDCALGPWVRRHERGAVWCLRVHRRVETRAVVTCIFSRLPSFSAAPRRPRFCPHDVLANVRSPAESGR